MLNITFKNVVSLMDARMNELYIGCFQLDSNTSLMTPVIHDQIQPVEIELNDIDLPTGFDSLYGCGHGFKLTDKLSKSLLNSCITVESEQILEAKSLLPLANALLVQNKTLLPEEVELVYLREQSHWKTIKEQKLLKKER